MANTAEYYLSKGVDRKTADYFSSGKKRITEVVPNNDFTLKISFGNSEKRPYVMRLLLKKEQYLNRLLSWKIFVGFMWMIPIA